MFSAPKVPGGKDIFVKTKDFKTMLGKYETEVPRGEEMSPEPADVHVDLFVQDDMLVKDDFLVFIQV